MHFAHFNTPIGWLTLVSGDSGLTELRFGRHQPTGMEQNVSVHREAVRQLDEYFQGHRRRFDLMLDPKGTEFQRDVWDSLAEIPFGEVRTYGEIARAVGRPGAARAVGMANHVNPIAIVIPCHRVIGSDGSLTGYSAGLDLKARLLAFEGALEPEVAAAEPRARGLSTLRSISAAV